MQLARFVIGLSLAIGSFASSACSVGAEATGSEQSRLEQAQLPCEVESALTICQGCHAATPVNEATFSLMTYSDTQQGRYPVWQLMGQVLRGKTMPPAPRTLSDADSAVLLRWIDDGAPPRSTTTACASPVVP